MIDTEIYVSRSGHKVYLPNIEEVFKWRENYRKWLNGEPNDDECFVLISEFEKFKALTKNV